MTHALRSLLERHVTAGTVPGAVATFGQDLDPVAVGSADLSGTPLAVDAIFRIQSMTKAVTTTAALALVEDGVLALDDPIAPWIPELAAPTVLPHPDAELGTAVPAARPITLRHLLTNQSGVGMMTSDSPLSRAMTEGGIEAGPDPVGLGSHEWLEVLSTLPLAFQPGEGWRYHHSFGLLGILLGRLGQGSTREVLQRTVLGPAGMVDTDFTVPAETAHRLPPAFRRAEEGFEQVDAAAGGFYAGPEPYDLSHAELVSTVTDYHAFLRALLDGRLISDVHLAEMRRDQIDPAHKTDQSFFPGFWTGLGWGLGGTVVTEGPHAGRFGWSGGLGTDFFIDPDGTICILLCQLEMDQTFFGLLGDLQDLS